MTLPRLALAALLLATPLLSHAQTAAPDAAAPAAASRLYVGLAAYSSYYQNLGGWRQGDTGFRLPLQLTAGYQLRPRLALELGVAYSGRTGRYDYDGRFNTFLPDGSLSTYRYQASTAITERATSVSALARYTLTRKPNHRFQADALGGFMLAHRSFHSRGSKGDDLSGNFQTTSFDNNGSFNNLLLTAGLGLRYRLTPRFGLNLDYTINRNLGGPSSFSGFTSSAALGLRYRLGR